MTTIKELADMMNTTEEMLASYIECLRVWINKGFTLEESIKKHMAYMDWMAANAEEIANDPEVRRVIVDAFYQ